MGPHWATVCQSPSLALGWLQEAGPYLQDALDVTLALSGPSPLLPKGPGAGPHLDIPPRTKHLVSEAASSGPAWWGLWVVSAHLGCQLTHGQDASRCHNGRSLSTLELPGADSFLPLSLPGLSFPGLP